MSMPTTRSGDAAPARSATREIAQVAVFAALIVVLGLPGQLSIGSAGVPITLQTLGVMVAGSILGWRKGLFSVLTVVAVVVAAAVTGTPMAGDRTPGSEWLLTIGIPFVLVVLLPALTPSGASIGQRIVWLRPESETGGGFGLWRRVARICAATLPVVVVRSLGVLGVGGRTELWSLAAIGLTLFIAAFALVDREHRGLSGRLAGVRYVDVRADRARGDQPVAASASSPARPLATRR